MKQDTRAVFIALVMMGCPLLALSRHELVHRTCPLSGLKHPRCLLSG
jgi:hypothetical protein